MADDNQEFDKRAAPTRKHKFIQEPLVPGLDPNENGSAEEVIEKVTGKRFSLTQLLKRKSKKDDSNKDDSNKEETNEESSTETKEKQTESKSYNTLKMEDDELEFHTCAAPTRKHKFIQKPFVPGRRFSLTQLLKRKSNKEDSNKDDKNKDDSNKEETIGESSTETKEKQTESKSD